MDFLKTLGFDPVMLGAQIINFLIIFFLLKRFLYKPVMDMVKKREDVIKEGLKQAEESRLTLEKTIEKEKKILSNAQDEAKKIIEDTKTQALEISKEIEQNTKKQTEKMIMEAKTQIEQEAKNLERKLTENVSILAGNMISKTLEGMFGEKEQKQIVEKAIKDIKKIN